MTFRQSLTEARELSKAQGRLVFDWELAAPWDATQGFCPYGEGYTDRAWRVALVVDDRVVAEGYGHDGASAINMLTHRLRKGQRLERPLLLCDWLHKRA